MDVWYVAYGSNLSPHRFRCYLEGGRPEGSARTHPPSRDPSPPSADRPTWLPHSLYFAGRSRSWGGGVAFVSPERGGEAPGRAYRLTQEQLEDVYAQENGMSPGSALPPEAWDGPVHDLGTGGYRLLVRLDDVDGEAAFTVTGPGRDDRRAPAPAYLRHIAIGLEESHGMSMEQVADLLLERPEVGDRYGRQELLSALE